MPVNGLRAFYYEKFPIELLDYFDIPIKRTGGVKTGGMQPKRFQKLVEDITANGLINPVIVEDNNVSLKVVMGNNRVEAMKQLGHTEIKAVVITKNCKDAPIEGAKDISLHEFEKTMKEVHPGDDTWRYSHYAKQICKSFRQET